VYFVLAGVGFLVLLIALVLYLKRKKKKKQVIPEKCSTVSAKAFEDDAQVSSHSHSDHEYAIPPSEFTPLTNLDSAASLPNSPINSPTSALRHPVNTKRAGTLAALASNSTPLSVSQGTQDIALTISPNKPTLSQNPHEQQQKLRRQQKEAKYVKERAFREELQRQQQAKEVKEAKDALEAKDRAIREEQEAKDRAIREEQEAKERALRERKEAEERERRRLEEEKRAEERKVEEERLRKEREEAERIERAKQEAPYAELITKYALFIGKMEDFERKARDPKRLFGSSAKLLEQERFRKTQWPRLAALQHQLMTALVEFEEKYNRRMMNGTRDALNDLEYDKNVRFASDTGVPLDSVEGTPSISPVAVVRAGGLTALKMKTEQLPKVAKRLRNKNQPNTR
jgi:hypothetical protein